MSPTQAINKARSESSIHQGSGWIFSSYDPSVGCHRTTGELTYAVARNRRARWNATRAAELQS